MNELISIGPIGLIEGHPSIIGPDNYNNEFFIGVVYIVIIYIC